MSFYLSKNDDIEVNINKVIQEVIRLERTFGMTDDDIISKYTCGCCGDLAEMIRVALMQFADQKVFLDVGGVIEHHCAVYIIDPKNKNIFYNKVYFDILGRHEQKDVEKWKEDFDYIQKVTGPQCKKNDETVRAQWRKNFLKIQCDFFHNLEEMKTHTPE